MSSPERPAGPHGGRSFTGAGSRPAVLRRCAAGALGRIAAAIGSGGTALVVTHGGVIGTLERALDVPRGARLPNLGGRWFTVGPGHLGAGEAVLLVDEDEVSVPGQL